MKLNQFEQKSGIYRITNIINNKIYIGSSINISIRISYHKNILKKNKHGNKYLQRSYNKYGIKSFLYDIIEYCDESLLLSKEEYYMNLFNCLNPKKGYNLDFFENGRTKRGKFNKEWLQNLSNSGSLYWDLYDLYNNKILNNKKTEFIAKYVKCSTKMITESFLKNYIIKKSYIIVKPNNLPNYKLFLSLDKQKLYEKRNGHKRKKILLIKDKIELPFDSVKEASIYLNTSSSHISQSLIKRCKVKGFIAKYKNK